MGKTLRSAKALLRDRDCRLGEVTRAYSQTGKGKVIAQKPKAGASLREGAKVNVVVSRGPKPKHTRTHQRPH